MMAINVLTVYLPFYFQATKGVSPATSGLYILALGIPNSLANGGLWFCDNLDKVLRPLSNGWRRGISGRLWPAIDSQRRQ